MSFAETMSKYNGATISKNLSGQRSQKLFDHAKQSALETIKTISKIVIQKTAQETCGLTGNEIAD